jgi:pimeloyl-ACP methyl ester carboxylesterase
VAHIDGPMSTPVPGTSFEEAYVETDGFRIRYFDAGRGQPVVYLHGAGGPRLSRAHDLLAERFRVIAFEVPGFGRSAANETSASVRDLARTLAQAAASLGLERYSLLGSSFGGKLAAWMAILFPERIEALVLAAPAAILPEGHTIPHLPPERAIARPVGPRKTESARPTLERPSPR